MAKKITAQELKRKIDRNEAPTILEALPFKYYRKAHLPGGLNYPLEEGDALARKLLPDQEAEIVVYCADHACPNSRTLVARLESLGYPNVYEYSGGKEEWIRRGYPVAKGADPQSQEESTPRMSCCG